MKSFFTFGILRKYNGEYLKFQHRINYDYFRNIKLLFNLKAFVPHYEIAELSELNSIMKSKYRGIIFDIDQTLVSYRDDIVSTNNVKQIEYLKKDYKCCLLSNYRKNEFQTDRVNNISLQIGIPIVTTKNKKPSSLAFQAALKTLNLPAKDVIMLGDRIITDIIGANSIGITSVCIKPIDPLGDPFLLVIIPRTIERFILKAIKAFSVMSKK